MTPRDDENLDVLVDELLAAARAASSGRAARTITGRPDRDLRETVIALAAGTKMAEHDSPGDATLQVLAGRVRMWAGEDAWELTVGDHMAIPPRRHGVDALEDSAILLTVVKPRSGGADSAGHAS